MKYDHLKRHIITPTLWLMGRKFHSAESVELLCGVCAVESKGGRYLKQKGDGPALGIYQIEPFTHDSIWADHLDYYDQSLIDIIISNCRVNHSALINDLVYATIIARLVFWFATPEPIPKNERGQAVYWKKHYNTHKGKGTVTDYLEAYDKFKRGLL